jgi:hypothetical protein
MNQMFAVVIWRDIIHWYLECMLTHVGVVGFWNIYLIYYLHSSFEKFTLDMNVAYAFSVERSKSVKRCAP